MTKLSIQPHGSAESSAAERWELIERILNSPELKRSHRLRELLHFLGEQSIHQGVTSLREQKIGEAVFGRSTDYDTSLDNIVRVNVTELRKRISLYFETEGCNEELLVEIPRGSYIPFFSQRLPRLPELVVLPSASEPVEPPQPEESEPAEPAEPATKTPPHDHYRIAFGCVAVVAVLALAAVALLWWQNATLRAQVYPWQADPAKRAFWSTFFKSEGEVDMVTADTSLALAEDILKRPVSLNDYLDYKYKDLTGLPGLTEETRQALNQILSRSLGSVGDFRVAAEIMALDGHAHSLRLANARAFEPDNIKANNVILIGGPVSNPWTSLYLDRMDFYQVYDTVSHRPSFINRAPLAGEPTIWDPAGNPDRGYSIVAFLPNLNPHRYALIIAGTDSQATLAAGEWLTSGEGLTWIREKAPQGPFPFFEVLLTNSKLVGTPLQTEVKAYRVHPR